jgi:hypothetical protein
MLGRPASRGLVAPNLWEYTLKATTLKLGYRPSLIIKNQGIKLVSSNLGYLLQGGRFAL